MRITQEDIQVTWPRGFLLIPCDNSCDPYRRGEIGNWHRYQGYTKKEAWALWREEHTTKNGDN